MNYQDEKVNVNADGITMPTDCSYAADLFSQLSVEAQDAIIDLIKSLLSAK